MTIVFSSFIKVRELSEISSAFDIVKVSFCVCIVRDDCLSCVIYLGLGTKFCCRKFQIGSCKCYLFKSIIEFES